jgi:predicted lipid-binding transport protein (Tim44 family)
MKLWLIGALMVAIATSAVPSDALAKRLGGGKPAGLQRSMPARTAPDAPPAKPAQPAQQAAPTTPAATPATPAAAPKRSWMGPLADLAAGLGLAALMSHFGMGEGLANVMMMALVAGALIFGVMFLLRRFGGGGAARSPALAGVGAGGASPQGAWPAVAAPELLQRNAVPEPFAAATPTVTPGPAGAEAPAVTRAFVPASFDSEGFARTAKMIFIRLQAANDTADLDDLRRFTTPELFASLRVDLQERGSAPQQTDVIKVETEVLDVANEAERQVVSVRFHGQVVEEKGAAPTDFNEVWHLVKPHDDSRAWAIAGIEQMN